MTRSSDSSASLAACSTTAEFQSAPTKTGLKSFKSVCSPRDWGASGTFRHFINVYIPHQTLSGLLMRWCVSEQWHSSFLIMSQIKIHIQYMIKVSFSVKHVENKHKLKKHYRESSSDSRGCPDFIHPLFTAHWFIFLITLKDYGKPAHTTQWHINTPTHAQPSQKHTHTHRAFPLGFFSCWEIFTYLQLYSIWSSRLVQLGRVDGKSD